MPRPQKNRVVRGIPSSNFFKPAGIAKSDLKISYLQDDEFEAVRLKDMLGLDQEDCAEKMGVSQPTFCRIIKSARKKIAGAIVNGQAIHINR